MPARAKPREPGLARTVARLRWYRQGFEEAVPGYRGRIFAQDAAHRALQAERVRGARRALRGGRAPRGPRADRTLARLNWYLDGLRDAAPNYRGIAFAAELSSRPARKARVEAELEAIEARKVPARAPAMRKGRGRPGRGGGA